MRTLFAVCTALSLSFSLPAIAADDGVKPAVAQTREQRIDQLFTDLKHTRSPKSAELVAGRIWNEWNRSGSASVDLMMQWSQKAIEDKKFDVALDFLDQVVTLQPKYAEGWNRRATAHFLMKNYAKSMVDIEQTLELEPRHFGALSGMAQIMTETGRKQAALDAWQKVLDLYPMLRNAQDQVSKLSEELAGEAI
ncbi:hypothetical protein MAUB1S_06820 [Mycolicibacterium aubagnense]